MYIVWHSIEYTIHHINKRGRISPIYLCYGYLLFVILLDQSMSRCLIEELRIFKYLVQPVRKILARKVTIILY